MLKYKSVLSLLLSLVILLSISACNEFNAPPKKLSVKVETEKNIKEMEQVLMKRFKAYPASTLASISSVINDKTITYTFKRGIPEKDLLRYLVETKGKLIAYIGENEAEPLFSNKDIHNAVASIAEANGDYVINISLTENAVTIMKAKTTKNIGKITTMKLDGEIITKARIMTALGKHFQINIEKPPRELARIAALLRSGALPEKAQLISILDAE